MTETKTKRSTSKPKKSVAKPRKVEELKKNEITEEDIQKALKEIMEEKMIGVKEFEPQLVEETPTNEEVLETVISLFEKKESTQPPLYLQHNMNVLTRMYETSEDNYKNVKYNPLDKTLQINLSAKQFPNLNKEIDRIKYQLCYDTLKYKGYVLEGESPRILIIISEK